VNIHLLIMARPIHKLKDIEAAAIRLFGARGVGRVTTKDIAREAGTAEGALYRHYSGIEDMAWSLYKREVEAFGARVKKVLSSPKSYAARIRESVSLFYEFFDHDRVTFAFILLSEHQFSPNRKISPRFNPELLVYSFIQQGVKEGAFQHPHRDLAAAMVIGMVLTPAMHCLTRKLKGPLSRHINDVAEGCLRILVADL
jgi:AcrR family transcriptional regulator